MNDELSLVIAATLVQSVDQSNKALKHETRQRCTRRDQEMNVRTCEEEPTNESL